MINLLRCALDDASASELQIKLNFNDRVHFFKEYLQPALEQGLIERTIPDKPRSPKQRYRTTAVGRALIGVERDDSVPNIL